MFNKFISKDFLKFLFAISCCLPLLNTGAAPINFTMKNYNQCLAQLRQCPKHGPSYSIRCMANLINNTPSCQALTEIAKQLNTTIDTLRVLPVHGFYLITQQFFADGQQQFFLLTPQEKLINTIIDPRSLDVPLKKKYAKSIWLITNTTTPHYQRLDPHQVAFAVNLKINKNCLACQPFGYVTVLFVFDNHGELLSKELTAFISHAS